MRTSTSGRLVLLPAKILIAALMLLQAAAVLAAPPTGPTGPHGPPPPPTPPQPCISTGLIAFAPVVFCTVRNVGVVTHNVTMDVRDEDNLSAGFSGNATPSLGPGTSNFIVASSISFQEACVVTTDEGTPDALADLSVVLYYVTGNEGNPTSETAGQIFKKCAPSNGQEMFPCAGNRTPAQRSSVVRAKGVNNPVPLPAAGRG